MSDILKFLTCGSVDDGKSTLIGHILFGTGNVYEDQIELLEAESRRIGNAGEYLDYSLLLDGLIAEREQGITIDVAFRYFSTKKRKFIVADTPGHIQYTRNMATGASNCAAAVILIDARLGVLPQTRRHALICGLLGIKYILFAINKMDLINYDRFRYEAISLECNRISEDLKNIGIQFECFHSVPVSAVMGDNLISKSERTSWYDGVTVIEWLELIQPENVLKNKPFRFPIQYVIKPGLSKDKWQSESLNIFTPEEQRNFRGYAGKIESGSVSVGDKILVLPSRTASSVGTIIHGDKQVETAQFGDSVTILLDDEIDVSRYSCFSHLENSPAMSDQFKARIVWMDEQPLYSGRRYIFMSPFGTINATIVRINDSIDLSGYQKLAAEKLEMNDIGEVEISLSRPVPFDIYTDIRGTGAFILIDRITNTTSGCGMISYSLRRSDNVQWQEIDITRYMRAKNMGQKSVVLWLTGLSGSGKTTIANIIEKKLFAIGKHAMLLDGDNLRHGLNRDLGFTEADRVENIRRAGEIAGLMAEAGLIVITAFISPFRADREMVRSLMPAGEFIEIFVDTPLEICEQRDPKGLYVRARKGEIPNFTGINSPYEKPEKPDIILNTVENTSDILADFVIDYLKKKEII